MNIYDRLFISTAVAFPSTFSNLSSFADFLGDVLQAVITPNVTIEPAVPMTVKRCSFFPSIDLKHAIVFLSQLVMLKVYFVI